MLLKTMITMNKIEVYGYSERGIFNSIVFYLRENPEKMKLFLTVLGIDDTLRDSEDIIYTLLNEQSFSDFGDSDLVIIAENKQQSTKTVAFVEGKVKTSQGNFSLNQNFEKLKNKEKFEGFSSNIFVQLYYKHLLVEVLKTDKIDTKALNIDDIFKKKERGSNNKLERSKGNNPIVLKAMDLIKCAYNYYFIAIMPDTTGFHEKLSQLHFIPREKVNSFKCVKWEDIEKEFIDSVVSSNFNYNKGQIY